MKLCDIPGCGEESVPDCRVVIEYDGEEIPLILCPNHHRYISPDLIGFTIRDGEVVPE